MQLQGSGFSTNTGGTGNIVRIGPYFCDPVPLHCTVNQIACKTRPALEGRSAPPSPLHRRSTMQRAWQRTLSLMFPNTRLVCAGQWNDWEGWTEHLPVSVEVDGQTSVCKATPGNDCRFRYHYGWYHTPRIYSLQPRSVEEGSIVEVKGRFHRTPFDFDELRAPSMEIPLASVKIANRAAEAQRAENEPFGQSGTRCALFNQEIEEPYGVVEGNNEVTGFRCQVNGPREAGRYNLSVALLGTQMKDDWNMNMGEAHVHKHNYQADHEGVSFMLQHVATVASVTPTQSGLQGGARLTISGTGFTNDKSLVQVSVGGVPCHVQLATMSVIECVLAPRAGGFQQGERQDEHQRLAQQRALQRFQHYGGGTLARRVARELHILAGPALGPRSSNAVHGLFPRASVWQLFLLACSR